MDPAVFDRFKAETNAAKKRRLLGELVASNEQFMRGHIAKLCRSHNVMETEDHFQAGRIGLMKAFEKFDPSRGTFGQYAKSWILDQFQQCILHDVAIYQPRRPHLAKVVKLANEIERATGRPATALELGMTETKLTEWRTEGRVVGSTDSKPLNTCESRGAVGKSADSLDAGRDGLDGQQEDTETPPADELLEKQESELLAVSLVDEVLDERERQVIKALFLEEKGVAIVAKELKMSPNSVLEIRDRALATLREEMEDT